MENQYRNLLKLLGAFLRQETVTLPGNRNWEQLNMLARIHGVSGILGYMAMKTTPAPTREEKTGLRRICMNTIAVCSKRYAMAEELTAVLAKEKIDHILMKGFELRNLYPVPELRTFNDIDIVIRPEDRQRSHKIMLELGFRARTDWEPVYSYVRGEEHYEFHTRIMEMDDSRDAAFQAYFHDLWNHTRQVSPHSYRFSPEYHALYLLAHIAKHVHSAGAGIRMYMDMAVFLRHNRHTLDWKWLEKQIRVLKLSRFADVVFAAVKEWFGVDCPLARNTVSKEILNDFLVFTMEAGVFGHFGRDNATARMKNEQNTDPTSRVKKALQRTFPEARAIEKRYTYLQDRPWLLPVAWAHRIVKNREKLGDKSREMQKIISMESDHIRRLQKLMRDIGL